MNKTKIEWTDYTWNPIKGLCPVGCWYCYARRIYQRFGWDPKLSLETMVNPPHRKQGSKIFVCSTIELFHPQIKREWRDYIFSVIKDLPYFTFQILTKFPQNIDREMPDNVWLGVSITEPKEMYPRIKNLYKAQAKLKFISFEPLLGNVGQFRFEGFLGGRVNWVIVGKLTGHGHKYDPEISWIKKIVTYCADSGIKIFLKDNLKSIWGENLIQEFPE